MTTRRKPVWLVVAALAVFSAPLAAQNHSAEGYYGSIQLETGFLPDPRTIDIDAGGDMDASQANSNCRGYINSSQPDLVLDLNQPRQPINIYVTSDADTTLVVRTPTGGWLCDDDSYDTNPLVVLAKPTSGRYAIWVGTYSGGSYEPAQLHISELAPMWEAFGPGDGAGFMNVTAPARDANLELGAGFLPDPQRVSVTAGGLDDAGSLGAGCVGSVDASAPNVRIRITSRMPEFSVFAQSDADTTLVVHTPDGEWLCNDDSSNLDPAVTFDATPGDYAVWVGSWGGGTDSARLSVTEGPPMWLDGGQFSTDGPPRYGTVNVFPGFSPDPTRLSILAGGDFSADSLGFGCAGYIDSVSPDVAIDVSQPVAPFSVHARSDADTTLVVRTPTDDWVCNDDADGLDPAVTLDGTTGRYLVWLGTYGSTASESELVISSGQPDWEDTGPVWADEFQPPFDPTGMTAYEIVTRLQQEAPPGLLLWSGAEALGSDGVILNDVRIFEEPGDAEPTVTMDRIRINRFDFASAFRSVSPSFIDLQVEGMRVPQAVMEQADFPDFMRLEDYSFNFDLGYEFNEATGDLDMDRLDIDIPGYGSFEASMALSGVENVDAQNAMAMFETLPNQLQVRGIELGYRDQGLVRGLLESVAAEQGLALPALIETLVGQMRAAGAQFGFQGDPMMESITRAAEQFMRDLIRPEGTGRINLRVAPPVALDFATFMQLLETPDQASSRLGLSIQYLTKP